MVVGQPERKPSRAYVLQTASGETIPVLKEALVELSLGRRALRIWVFVTEVTDEFILGLDVLRAYDASVDLGRHLLRPWNTFTSTCMGRSFTCAPTTRP
jgi:hypothetical protein